MRFHVKGGDYRDPRVHHHHLQPMVQGALAPSDEGPSTGVMLRLAAPGDAAEGEYMENRKLNIRHDVVAGDYRGAAAGTSAMKQDMCPGEAAG